jgi:hypothetical protein
MIADTLEELHSMAEAIGMKLEWFQEKGKVPHYDVCKMRKQDALTKGAVLLERKAFVEKMRTVEGVKEQKGLPS